MEAVDQFDVIVADGSGDPDRLGGLLGDARHLRTGPVHGGGRVDPDDAPTTILERRTRDHAGVGRARDGADHHRVEEDPEVALLVGQLPDPVREAQAPERMVGCTGRDRIGPAAGLLDGGDGPLPAIADPDVEPGGIHADVPTHDAGELDVADLVVDHVGPVDPPLLHGHGLEAEVGGDPCDLAGVVGLHPTDRHERVAPRRECVRGEVLELTHLVATEGDPGVAVLAFGPHLDPTAEVRAQAPERVDR